MREASPDDADAVIDVVRKSIVQLCVADHRHDPDTLATWLANKTPQNFLSWLSNPDNFCVVVHANDRMSGVGLLHRSGEIRLFFLAPGEQRQGMGAAIHAALEEKANRWALRKLHLDSTALARRFYEALGYRPVGAAQVRFGVLHCYPYEKTLQPDNSLERAALSSPVKPC